MPESGSGMRSGRACETRAWVFGQEEISQVGPASVKLCGLQPCFSPY